MQNQQTTPETTPILDAETVRRTIEAQARVGSLKFADAIVEIADMLCVGRSTVYVWLKEGLPQGRPKMRARFEKLAIDHGVVETRTESSQNFRRTSPSGAKTRDLNTKTAQNDPKRGLRS